MPAFYFHRQIQFGPGKGTDVPFAPAIPPLFIHHIANGIGKPGGSHPVQSHLGHSQAPFFRFTAGFMIDIPGETMDVALDKLSLHRAVHQTRQDGETQTHRPEKNPGPPVAGHPHQTDVHPTVGAGKTHPQPGVLQPQGKTVILETVEPVFDHCSKYMINKGSFSKVLTLPEGAVFSR